MKRGAVLYLGPPAKTPLETQPPEPEASTDAGAGSQQRFSTTPIHSAPTPHNHPTHGDDDALCGSVPRLLWWSHYGG